MTLTTKLQRTIDEARAEIEGKAIARAIVKDKPEDVSLPSIPVEYPEGGSGYWSEDALEAE